MKYIKPEIRTQKFEIIDSVTADEESAGFVPDIDMGNDNGQDLGIETQQAFSEAFRNIF